MVMYYNIETEWPVSTLRVDDYVLFVSVPTLCPYFAGEEGYVDRNVYEQDSNIWIN